MSKQIVLRPHFGAGGKQAGWEITEGENIALNKNKADAEKAWGVSIRRYQQAGHTVEAKAFDAAGTLTAHGTYKPDGTVIDHGPGKPKAKPAKPPKAAATSPKRGKKKPAATAPAPAPTGKGKSKGGKGKGSRKPSAYNMHMAKRVPELRTQGYSAKDAFKRAAAEWSGKSSRPTGKGKSKGGKGKGKAPAMPTGKGKSKGGKGSRKPSAYNLYMGQRIPQLRAQGYAPGDAMKIAAEEWSRKKQ